MRSKFTEFVLLLGILHVAFSLPFGHADFDICKKRYGKFPKPGSSCTSYYKCVEFNAIEMRCPEDQHFFPAKEFCVWQEEYPCLEKAKSEKCPLPNGKFMKQNTRCKVYYHCRNGVPSEKRCKGELLFDPNRKECEYPEYVTCHEDVRPTDSPQSTPVITTFTFDETSVTTVTVPTASSTIIKRSTTSSDEISSEEDNQRSTKTKEMSTTVGSTTMLKSSTSTEGRTKPVTSTVTDNISTAFDKNGDSSEEHNLSSTKSEEMSTTLSSATMMKSSSITESRTEPINEDASTVSDKIGGNTDTHSSTKSENKPTTVAMSTLFKSSPIEENGTKQTTTTEKISTTSDERRDYTDVSDESASSTTFPENKHDSTIKTTSITDFVTSHIFCPRPNGYFPHPNDRHKFIACVEGNPIIMDCPENLIYNDKRRACEYEKI